MVRDDQWDFNVLKKFKRRNLEKDMSAPVVLALRLYLYFTDTILLVIVVTTPGSHNTCTKSHPFSPIHHSLSFTLRLTSMWLSNTALRIKLFLW